MLLTMMVLAAVLSLGGAGSFAFLNDSETSTGNVFRAGIWETPDTQFSAVGDTFLRQGVPNTSEGANPGLRIQASGNNRILVAFDLSGIDTSQVTRATLTLTILDNTDNWGITGRTIDAHRLLTSWVEGNGKDAELPAGESTRGTGAGATWNCAADADISNQNDDEAGSIEWAVKGGDYAPATAPSVLITNGLTGEVYFDVTADVQDGAPFGWLIRKTNEGVAGKIFFHSKESTTGPAPRLDLEFGQ